MKSTEIVNIRTRTLKNGNKSLYFDICKNGTRLPRKSLDLYLIPEKTKEDRDKNNETWERAKAMQSQKVLELFQNETGLEKQEQIEVKLIEYIQNVAERKLKLNKKGMYSNLQTLIAVLSKYQKSNIYLHEVDKTFARGFVEYLTYEAKSKRTKCNLKTATVLYYIHSYYFI